MAPKEVDYLEIAQQRAIEKKTHVSFPQLKYPSLRDEGLRDPVQWLTGKAIDDGAEETSEFPTRYHITCTQIR
ncbi:unnamed protein product [Leptidea sinapis]|uniref:Uncharacterized protein n=1 Tax=Leptidea sinapis TaxID=189913 RepID=A0A5E4QXD4_9NEOP|nr:unnamed protein product [Leptidea sinapis]